MNFTRIKGSQLETHHPFVKFVRIFTVPLLNSIPPHTLQNAIKKFSPYGKGIIENPAEARSLEVMYTKHETKSVSLLAGITDFFWHTFVSQPKAVRNRLRIVEENLEKEIGVLVERAHSEKIRILNLASGSSRAFIEAVSRLQKDAKPDFKITNVDINPDVIAQGMDLAKKFGVEQFFEWQTRDVRDLSQFVEKDSVDLVEMVGLLDYFNVEDSVKLLGDVYAAMKKGGVFVVANVYPNREQKFVKNVGWPTMYYKTEHELFGILKKAGFAEDLTTLILEPLEVHLIAVARK